ncbi:hypothetical protein FN846DRAFT_774267, partial [Sphaerosporella brunnea]
MEPTVTAPELTLTLRPQATITDSQERLVLPTLWTVQLCHPGDPNLPHVLHVILDLPAYDCADAVAGIHYNTANDACRIVSGNRPGVLLPTLLSPSQFQHRETAAAPLILTEPRYYFYPLDWSEADLQYPVCPTFDHWRFNHEAFHPPSPRAMPHWLSTQPQPNNTSEVPPSAVAQKVQACDAACRLSGFREACESAHIIPREKTDWFVRNSMGIFSNNREVSATNSTADVRNLVSMRRDLHRSFDDREFVFLPKGEPGEDFRIHLLRPTHDFGPLFHKRAVSGLTDDVARAFLYARFAWAIFPRLWRFV